MYLGEKVKNGFYPDLNIFKLCDENIFDLNQANSKKKIIHKK